MPLRGLRLPLLLGLAASACGGPEPMGQVVSLPAGPSGATCGCVDDEVRSGATSCHTVTLAHGLGARRVAVDDGSVYWIDWSGEAGGTTSIWRVAKSGGVPVKFAPAHASSPAVRDIRFGAGRLFYLTDPAAGDPTAVGSVRWIAPDGPSGEGALDAEGTPLRLALDTSTLYFSESIADGWGDRPPGGALRSFSLDGTANSYRAEGLPAIGGPVVTPGSLYWSAPDGIRRQPLRGGAPELVTPLTGDAFTIVEGPNGPIVFVVRGGALLRQDPGETATRRLHGESGVAAGSPAEIAADPTGSVIYWSVAGHLLRTAATGASTIPLAASSAAAPAAAFALDDKLVYWTSPDGRLLARCR